MKLVRGGRGELIELADLQTVLLEGHLHEAV